MADHDNGFREFVRKALEQGVEYAKRKRLRYDIWFFAGALWTAYPFLSRFGDSSDRFERRLCLALIKAVCVTKVSSTRACIEVMRTHLARHSIDMPQMSGYYEYADYVIRAGAAAFKNGGNDAKFFSGALWTARPFVERLVESSGYTRKLEHELRNAIIAGNERETRIAIGKMRSFARGEGVDMPDCHNAPIPGALMN